MLRRAAAALYGAFAPVTAFDLWTLTVDGHVAGSILRQGGAGYRLSVFESADPRLAELDGLAGAEVTALERAIVGRLGPQARVRLTATPV